MTGFSLSENYTDNPERLVRRVRPRVIPPLAILPPVATLSVEGTENFELKSSLINMVQASPFCGKPNEDANAHLQNFLELCDTVVIRGVTTDVVKLRLFPFFPPGEGETVVL